MPEYTPTLEEIRTAVCSDEPNGYTHEEFDAFLAAHVAVVRADQAEKDAQIAEATSPTYGNTSAWDFPGNRAVAEEIRRAVVLTPTTKEPSDG